MIKIDPGKSKELRFKMEVQGVSGPVGSRLVLPTKNGYSLIFESVVMSGMTTIVIPPLGELGKTTTGEVRLEVMADNYVLTPWTGTIQFAESFSVRSVVVEDESSQVKSSVLKVESVVVEENAPLEKSAAEKKPEPVAEKRKRAADVINGVSEWLRSQGEKGFGS